MISITLPWWGWGLFGCVLSIVSKLIAWAGEKTGRAAYRRWKLWRDRRLMEWSRRG